MTGRDESARMLPPKGMYGAWHCERCGEIVDSKDRFCRWCGAAFDRWKKVDYEMIRSEK